MPEPIESRGSYIRSALSSFAAGRDLTPEELGALSSLPAAEGETFERAWAGLSEALRSTLLLTLNTAERRDVRLDYRTVYGLAMRDPSAEVRRWAAAAVGQDDAGALLDPLLSLLTHDESPEVRAAAASALAPYAYRAEVGELPAADAQDIRARLLETARTGSEPAAVRASALASVGFFSDTEVQSEVATGFEIGSLRLGALRAMGRSADPHWLQTLLAALESDDPAEREEAARAVGEIEDERAVAALVNAFEDDARDVRVAAIRALDQIGGEEAREALQFAVGDEDPVVSAAAEQALSELESHDDPFAD